MERILIVEDNKTLANLIAKKIKSSLKFEVDIAYKLGEAKLFLHKYQYFLTLLDINLPDAPDGEVVDYVLSKKQHAIVLSANIDKDFRKKILQKNIIDYVNKGGVDDINYIIQIIKRLQKNREHKVLVVDDSMVFRKQMDGFLKNLFYKVYTVAHGEEALGMLKTHPDISLMITDYNMPVMNGIELVHEVRKEKNKNDLCIIAISGNNDEEINALFLKHGANDYIKKPFSKEEFSCRVNNSIEALENIHIITNHANRDYLTGLYNRRYFFENMQNYIKDISDTNEKFAVAMIDIDYFKKVNDTYGHEVGDRVIVHLADILRTSTSYRDLVSRFGGEEFCVVLKNINRYSAIDILERIRSDVESYTFTTSKGESLKFTISIGATMYVDEDGLDEAINNADMMLYNAKTNGRNQVVFS
jgi:diguanylate cyclase (GGDEF)-like protein